MSGRLHRQIIRAVSSNWLFWAIITLFVIQALWIALSFRFPMLYDESFHVPVIEIFSKQLSPVIVNQPSVYDVYGNLSNGDATIYHYLMSYPYRLVGYFTESQAMQVIFMRLINIALFTTGLILFAQVFKKAGVKQAFISVAILIFTLLPIVPFAAAHVNYDNLLFPLAALYLYFCVKLLRASEPVMTDYIWVIILGCIASVVKYTFLPIFALTFIFITVFYLKSYGKSVLSHIATSVKRLGKKQTGAYAVAVILMTAIFSYTYVVDIFIYGTPQPECIDTLGRERCMARYVEYRNITAEETRDSRELDSLPKYTSGWTNQIFHGINFSAANIEDGTLVTGKPLPLFHSLIFSLSVFGLIIVAYSWIKVRKNIAHSFLMYVAIVTIASVFVFNYTNYIKLHAVHAIQPRYLLISILILILFATLSVSFLLRRRKWLKIILLVGGVLVLMTQGGGAVTHLIRSQSNWYWQNTKVIEFNEGAKKLITPFVKEN